METQTQTESRRRREMPPILDPGFVHDFLWFKLLLNTLGVH